MMEISEDDFMDSMETLFAEVDDFSRSFGLLNDTDCKLVKASNDTSSTTDVCSLPGTESPKTLDSALDVNEGYTILRDTGIYANKTLGNSLGRSGPTCCVSVETVHSGTDTDSVHNFKKRDWKHEKNPEALFSSRKSSCERHTKQGNCAFTKTTGFSRAVLPQSETTHSSQGFVALDELVTEGKVDCMKGKERSECERKDKGKESGNWGKMSEESSCNDFSHVRDYGDNTCSYSSFINSTESSEDYNDTVVYNEQGNSSQNAETNSEILSQVGERATVAHDKLLAECILRKRKRNLSVSDNEHTPKQRKGLFDPKYSGKCTILSPILSPIKPFSEDTQGKAVKRFSESTPSVLSKFSHHYKEMNMTKTCSTPLVPSEKDKLKAKKAILKFDRINTDSETSDSELFFADKPATRPGDDVDELIREITAICEEGLHTENSIVFDEDENEEGNQISKIDIKELISTMSNESENTLVENEDNNKTGKESEENANNKVDIGKTDEGENKNNCASKDRKNATKGLTDTSKVTGRFKNVTANITKVELIKDEGDIEDDGDILGLDDLDDADGFVDEDVLTALSKSGVIPDIVPDADKTIVGDEKQTPGLGDLERNNNEIVISITLSGAKHVEAAMINTEKADLVENKDNVNEKVLAESKNDKNLTRTVKNEKKSELLNDQILEDFNSSYCHLEDNSPEMQVARLRWKSPGIPDPEVNLTVATAFRKRIMSSGRTSPVGVLEGEKICCSNLYENERNTCTYEEMQCTSVEFILSRLHSQKAMLERIHYNVVSNLRSQMQNDVETMKMRHRKEISHLRHRQNCEYRSVQQQCDENSVVLQASMMQLVIEHRKQRKHMQAHHMSVYQTLCENWNRKLQEDLDNYNQRCNTLNEQIDQIENMDINTDIRSQYGPPVLVKLRKAPCRATDGKHGQVTVCLSAQIAQAVCLEDDIYDHFYRYKESPASKNRFVC